MRILFVFPNISDAGYKLVKGYWNPFQPRET